jgi:hypothetical protein
MVALAGIDLALSIQACCFDLKILKKLSPKISLLAIAASLDDRFIRIHTQA